MAEQIDGAYFIYSAQIIPITYLKSQGFLKSDKGRFVYQGLYYSLHRTLGIERHNINPEWAAMVAVFAPEQAVHSYGPGRCLHLPAIPLADTDLYGFSLRFSSRPGIRTLREIESAVNREGLLGEVVVTPTNDTLVAFTSPQLLDALDNTDFPLPARGEVLANYGLRANNINVLSMPYKT